MVLALVVTKFTVRDSCGHLFNGVVEFVNYILVFSRHGWEEDILGLVQGMLLFEYLVEVLPKSMRYKLYFEVLLVFVDEEPLIL